MDGRFFIAKHFYYILQEVFPMKDMPKAYDHSAVEQTLYDRWEKAGYFHAAPNPDKTPYTIVIPPAQHHRQTPYGPRPGRDLAGRAHPL